MDQLILVHSIKYKPQILWEYVPLKLISKDALHPDWLKLSNFAKKLLNFLPLDLQIY